MPQRKHHINLDPEWLTLIGKKYLFSDVLAPHPSIIELGLMQIVSVIYEADDLPQLGLWTPENDDHIYYYSIIRLKMDIHPESTAPLPKRLLKLAGISRSAQQMMIEEAG